MTEHRTNFEGKEYRVKVYRALYQKVERAPGLGGPVYILTGREGPLSVLPGDLNLGQVLKLSRALGNIALTAYPDVYKDADVILFQGLRLAEITIARPYECTEGEQYGKQPWVPIFWRGVRGK